MSDVKVQIFEKTYFIQHGPKEFGHFCTLQSHLNMSGCSLETQWHLQTNDARAFLRPSHFIFANKTNWPQADFDKNIWQESVQIYKKKI